ncbi:hypothetical protein ACOMHN_057323 [Nucella lapillus]
MISQFIRGPAKWRSVRFILSYLAGLGLCVVYFQRVSLSLAIVCMVNHTALHVQKDSLLTIEAGGESDNVSVVYKTSDLHHTTTPRKNSNCPSSDDRDGSATNAKEDGPFVWDKETQGLLLSALYISYTLLQIPASYLIRRHGVRLTAGVSVVGMPVCHVLCHPAALLSPWAVLALRICMGACTAPTIPAIYGIWGRWAPKSEQSQLLGIAFSGQMIANATVFPISAVLCRYGFLGRWPSIFHVFGVLGLVWSVVWFLLMTDSPETHPGITASERHYIVTTRADVTQHKKQSPSFWAIAVAQFVYDWGFFLIMTNLPTFLYETMHFDIQSNGIFSMLPYIALFLVTSSAGFLSDVMIKREWMSVAAVRKLCTTVALCTAAVVLVAMSHMQCDQVAAVVVMLTVAVGISGLALTGGFFVNPYDIAPHFAVSICTVTNTISCVAGFLNPYFVAAVTANQKREEWQLVFYVTGALYVAGSRVYCVWGRGQLQPWALPDPHPDTCIQAEPLDNTTPDTTTPL